jgi:hypothetical protein
LAEKKAYSKKASLKIIFVTSRLEEEPEVLG